MNANKVAVIAAAFIAGPLLSLGGIVFFIGMSIGSMGGSAQGVTSTCLYSYPRADAVAATIAELTDHPVQPDHWSEYRDLTSSASGTYDSATDEQLRAVLDTASIRILQDTQPGSIATVPIIWWHGEMPQDDNDDAWMQAPVEGFDGNLSDYLIEFVGEYPNHLPDDFTCDPPATCNQPAHIAAILATIRHHESGGDYTIKHPKASASGAYQYIDSTWQHWAEIAGVDIEQYPTASSAPADVQDLVAATNVDDILATHTNDLAAVPVIWYYPAAWGDPVLMNQVPYPEAGNKLTVAEYQTKWMDYYNTTAVNDTGGQPVNCGHPAVEWGETQIGAPYAAINPYRFGHPAWPAGPDGNGARICGFRQGPNCLNPYQFPADTIVYDCSGFIIAAYRNAGIDFTSQHGILSSQQWATADIPDAPREQLQPGDIAIYAPVNGVGHVVMIHHTEPDGTVKTLEAAAGSGVKIGELDWDRIKAIKRPTLPAPVTEPGAPATTAPSSAAPANKR